jgi:hypothetical protein
MGFFILEPFIKEIKAIDDAFDIFNFLKLSKLIPPRAHNFKLQFIDIKLNLVMPSILLLEYFALKKTGDNITSLQFCLFLTQYSKVL